MTYESAEAIELAVERYWLGGMSLAQARRRVASDLRQTHPARAATA